jgi:hypothetical protein
MTALPRLDGIAGRQDSAELAFAEPNAVLHSQPGQSEAALDVFQRRSLKGDRRATAEREHGDAIDILPGKARVGHGRTSCFDGQLTLGSAGIPSSL